MSPPVLVARRLRSQAPVAYVAREPLYPRVNVARMPVQRGCRAKTLVATMTRVRPLAGVRVSMDQKIVRGRQYLFAVTAFVIRGPVAVDFRAR